MDEKGGNPSNTRNVLNFRTTGPSEKMEVEEEASKGFRARTTSPLIENFEITETFTKNYN